MVISENHFNSPNTALLSREAEGPGPLMPRQLIECSACYFPDSQDYYFEVLAEKRNIQRGANSDREKLVDERVG